MVSSRRIGLDTSAIVKRFDTPEKVLMFDKGRLELITLGGRVIGKASYWPGWKEAQSAPPSRSEEGQCEYVGVVLSGRAKVVTQGRIAVDLTPGDFFYVTTDHASWVVGYRPCEILYLSGVETLVKRAASASQT